MNTKQIIAELRCGAAFNGHPFKRTTWGMFATIQSWAFDAQGLYAGLRNLPEDALRTFYLLVAEAMESE